MKVLQTILQIAGLSSLPVYPSLPSDHPASIQLAAWLAVFNTANEEALLKYHTGPNDIASRHVSTTSELGLAKATGGFNVVDIEAISDPSTIVVVMMEKARPKYVRATMVVDVTKDNYPFIKFDLGPINTPMKFIPKNDHRRPKYEKAFQPLTADTRRAVVDGIREVLEDQYIIPDAVENMTSALDIHLKNGAYDNITDSENFSKQLTEDLHASGHDKYMRIFFAEPQGKPDGTPQRSPPKKVFENLRSFNFGFQPISLDTTTVPGRTIAILPINGFIPTDVEFLSDYYQDVLAAISKILSSISDADVLLIDLRHNGGGSPHTVSFIMSYFLDNGPVHILDMVDRSGNVTASFSTLPVAELPANATLFGSTKPIYVLTSDETIAGGEEMAYDFQVFKRSKAVIGEGNEKTAGLANSATKVNYICDEIFGGGWWHILVPGVKPVHAVTKTNWQGAGVASDVVAGKGEWEGVSDAAEVGKKLFVRSLKREGREEL